MRTLDSGIGTFPLPDAGTRAAGRYIRQTDSPEDTDPSLSLQPALCAASSMRAQTLEREVPSSADSQGSADNTLVHSTSDPIMTARGMRPLQSLLPKPASSGTVPLTFQMRLFSHQSHVLAHKNGKQAAEKVPTRSVNDLCPVEVCMHEIPLCPQPKSYKVKWSRSVVTDSATPWTVACQALPSMGFSGQEYGVGCHCLFQGIFPTQLLNPGLPHCRQTLLLSEPPKIPKVSTKHHQLLVLFKEPRLP